MPNEFLDLSTELHLYIDRPPRVHTSALDQDLHLVQIPPAGRSESEAAEIAGEHEPELDHPAPDALVGGLDAALGQELLHVAVAEGEAQVQPDSVADDLGWELVASVRDGLHAPCPTPTRAGLPPLRVTTPR